MKVSQLRSLALAATLCSTPAFAADSWTQWRGPDGQGHATTESIPLKFSESESVVWRTPLTGKGWSTPAIADGKIWLTAAVAKEASAEEQARRLAGDKLAGMKEVAAEVQLLGICLDYETGEPIHQVLLKTVTTPDPIHPLNTYASPSPIIDGDKVYLHFGAYGTWCLNRDTGDKLWENAVKLKHSVGPGSSPLLHDDRLILVCDGIDDQFVAALDTATGDEVWRTQRPPLRTTEPEYQKAYSTPITINVEGRDQVVVPGAQWLCSYDPASGKELWRADHGKGFSVSPMPIYAGGMVIFSTGYMKPEMVAVKPTGTGDVTQSHIVWRESRGAPAKPSPIAVGDSMFMVSDLGVLTKLDVATGSIVYRERLGGNYSASPVQIGDNLVFCSHEGNVTVVDASADKYTEVAKNELEPRLMASPVAVNGQLFIRTEDALYRFGS